MAASSSFRDGDDTSDAGEDADEWDGDADSDGGSDASDLSDCSSIGEGLTTELRHGLDEDDLFDGLETLEEIRAKMESIAVDDNSDSDAESDCSVEECNSLPQLRLYNVNAETRLLGGRRNIGEVRRGTRVGVQCYGEGQLLNDNYVQPKDHSLRPLKVVSAGHTWVKEPARAAQDVAFDLEAPPQLLKFGNDASLLDMFLSMWGEPASVWRRNTNRKGREISAAKKAQGKMWRWKHLMETVGSTAFRRRYQAYCEGVLVA